MKNKVIFATKNLGKFAEFKQYFERLSVNLEVISLNDMPDIDMPSCQETSTTFEENATIKALHTKKYLPIMHLNYPIVADDSGMTLDALSGEPGVFTRRWIGYDMTD